jgi:hypothetical protein
LLNKTSKIALIYWHLLRKYWRFPRKYFSSISASKWPKCLPLMGEIIFLKVKIGSHWPVCNPSWRTFDLAPNRSVGLSWSSPWTWPPGLARRCRSGADLTNHFGTKLTNCRTVVEFINQFRTRFTDCRTGVNFINQFRMILKDCRTGVDFKNKFGTRFTDCRSGVNFKNQFRLIFTDCRSGVDFINQFGTRFTDYTWLCKFIFRIAAFQGFLMPEKSYYYDYFAQHSDKLISVVFWGANLSQISGLKKSGRNGVL